MPNFFSSRIATVLLVVVALWLSVSAAVAFYERHTQERQLAELLGRIDDVERGSRALQDELDRMQAPQWLALLARQRLGYVQPGETAVFVYKTEDSDIVVQPQSPVEPEPPNWRKWLLWLRGQ